MNKGHIVSTAGPHWGSAFNLASKKVINRNIFSRPPQFRIFTLGTENRCNVSVENQGCPAYWDFLLQSVYFFSAKKSILFSLQLKNCFLWECCFANGVLKWIVNKRNWITWGNEPTQGRVKVMRMSYPLQAVCPFLIEPPVHYPLLVFLVANF